METFIFEGNKLNVINKYDDIWFRAKTVALILKYSNHRKAIIDHVDPEDKSRLKEINIGSNDSLPLTWNDENSIYINESGLYSLILRSDMDNAKKFKRWITKEVLPSLILSFKIFITCIQDLQLSLKVQLVTENYQSIKM